eukprot:g16473.t1
MRRMWVRFSHWSQPVLHHPRFRLILLSRFNDHDMMIQLSLANTRPSHKAYRYPTEAIFKKGLGRPIPSFKGNSVHFPAIFRALDTFLPKSNQD